MTAEAASTDEPTSSFTILSAAEMSMSAEELRLMTDEILGADAAVVTTQSEIAATLIGTSSLMDHHQMPAAAAAARPLSMSARPVMTAVLSTPSAPPASAGAFAIPPPANYSSFIPLDVYPSNVVVPSTRHPQIPVAPCLISQSWMCHSCVYSSPTQPCSIHQAPIAYGQTTSSHVAGGLAPNSGPTAASSGASSANAAAAAAAAAAQTQQILNTMTMHFVQPATAPHAAVLASAHNQPPVGPQATGSQPPQVLAAASQTPHAAMSANVVQQAGEVQLARHRTTLPPSLPRSVAMRLKRPGAASCEQGDSSTRLNKYARMSSDGQREIQTVHPTPMPSQSVPSHQMPVEPPSTSQHVTGDVPSGGQATVQCAMCGAVTMRGCPSACTCACNFCNTTQIVANAVNAAQAAAHNPMNFASVSNVTPQTAQHLAVAAQLSQAQAQAAAAAAAAATAVTQSLPGFPLRIVQDTMLTNSLVRQQQLQLLQQSQLHRILPQSANVYLLNSRQGFSAVDNNRMFELNMFVNLVPPEILVGERPTAILERHHMFAAAQAEPQPVGASPQDIEKCTEKVFFVKEEVPENEKERCTVCLNDFETGEEVRNLRCTHIFHVDCIDKWLIYNKKCPVCRLDVDKHKSLLVE